jgi:hypothetical protein
MKGNAMFFDIDDRKINLDHVKEARKKWSQSEEWTGVTLAYTDGKTEFFKGDPDALGDKFQDVAATVIPAAPGFTLLRINFHDALEVEGQPEVQTVLREVRRNTVIGWRIGEFGPEPISAYTPTWCDARAVLEPSGVVVGEDMDWDNIDEWAKDMCERWRRCQAAKTKAA